MVVFGSERQERAETEIVRGITVLFRLAGTNVGKVLSRNFFLFFLNKKKWVKKKKVRFLRYTTGLFKFPGKCRLASEF